jgi:hypothetical protein
MLHLCLGYSSIFQDTGLLLRPSFAYVLYDLGRRYLVIGLQHTIQFPILDPNFDLQIAYFHHLATDPGFYGGTSITRLVAQCSIHSTPVFPPVSVSLGLSSTPSNARWLIFTCAVSEYAAYLQHQ